MMDMVAKYGGLYIFVYILHINGKIQKFIIRVQACDMLLTYFVDQGLMANETMNQ